MANLPAWFSIVISIVSLGVSFSVYRAAQYPSADDLRGDWVCIGRCNWYDTRGDKIRIHAIHGSAVLELSNGCPKPTCSDEDKKLHLKDEDRSWVPTVYDQGSGTIHFVGEHSWGVQAAVSHDGKVIVMRCYENVSKNNGTAWVKVDRPDPGEKSFSTYLGGTSC